MIFTKRRGFSLVEVVIAALILAVTIGGVIGIFAAGSRFVFRANRRLSAANLAQREIERRRQYVRFDTWNGIANLDPELNELQVIALTNFGALPGNLLPNGQYRYSVTQAPHFNNPVGTASGVEGCRMVNMTVQWDES